MKISRTIAMLVVLAGANLARAQAEPAPPTEAQAAPPSAAPAQPAETSTIVPNDTSADIAALRTELERLREDNAKHAARIAQLEGHAQQAAIDTASEADSQVADLLAADPFRIYGFADFGVNHAWVGDRAFLKNIAYEDTTFVLGNLNLYFDFQPDPQWQVLTEIRLTSYPHGDEAEYGVGNGAGYERVDTTVFDVASPATGATFRWGSIVIERAYAQYSHSGLLNVRVGQFLTPYGIWNVDHGTPTQISLQLPWFIAIEALPQRQIGIEAFGSASAGDWELGYDAYLSNGRTASQLDFTENKALGLRLRASRLVPVPFTLGTSVYYGSLDDVQKYVASFTPFHINRDFTVDGHEVAVAVDVSLDIDALRIRSEGVMRMRRYEEGKRPALAFAAPGSFRPDTNEYFSYLIVAYRLPVWGLEPYGYGELDHSPSGFGDEQAVVGGGLNIHFTPFAQLKTQVSRAMFFDINDDGRFSDNNATMLFSRLAVAF